MRFEELGKRWSSDEAYQRARATELPKGYLGVNVLRLRAEYRLTQQELAHRAGLRQPRIAEIERGDSNPKLETLGKIAHALQVGVSDLLQDPSAVWSFVVESVASSVESVEVPGVPYPVNAFNLTATTSPQMVVVTVEPSQLQEVA